MAFMCRILGHNPGWWQPAVGGRNVKKCVRCKEIVEEESVVKQVMGRARPPLPKGKEHTEL